MLYGGPGPPATLVRELGQVRKEAATADDVCAGMRLGLPPIYLALKFKSHSFKHIKYSTLAAYLARYKRNSELNLNRYRSYY